MKTMSNKLVEIPTVHDVICRASSAIYLRRSPLVAAWKSLTTETRNARASFSMLSMEGLRAPRSRSET